MDVAFITLASYLPVHLFCELIVPRIAENGVRWVTNLLTRWRTYLEFVRAIEGFPDTLLTRLSGARVMGQIALTLADAERASQLLAGLSILIVVSRACRWVARQALMSGLPALDRAGLVQPSSVVWASVAWPLFVCACLLALVAFVWVSASVDARTWTMRCTLFQFADDVFAVARYSGALPWIACACIVIGVVLAHHAELTARFEAPGRRRKAFVDTATAAWQSVGMCSVALAAVAFLLHKL